MPNRILASELSPFSARLRIACALKRLDYAFEPAPGGSGSAELKKLAPFGRIPVLETSGRMLVESAALLDYLEDAYPDSPSLRPAGAVDRARARMITLLFDHNVVKAMSGIFAQLRKPLPDAAAAHAAFAEVRTEVGKLTCYFDAEGPAVGGRWSTADCAMAPFAFLMDALAAGFATTSPTRGASRFGKWWSEFSQLPEVTEVTIRMQRALAAMAAGQAPRAAAAMRPT